MTVRDQAEQVVHQYFHSDYWGLTDYMIAALADAGLLAAEPNPDQVLVNREDLWHAVDALEHPDRQRSVGLNTWVRLRAALDTAPQTGEQQ